MAGGKASFGSELWVVASGGSLVKLAYVNIVNPPEISRGTIEDTTHDSPGGAAEYIPEGVYEVGEITVEGNYISRSTDDTAIMGFITNGTKVDFKIVEKDASTGSKVTGSGYFTNYAPRIGGVKDKQSFSASIKVTGPITKAANS